MDIPNIDLVYKKLHDRLNENLNSRLEETISETNDGIFAAKKRIFHLICDVLDDYEISYRKPDIDDLIKTKIMDEAALQYKNIVKDNYQYLNLINDDILKYVIKQYSENNTLEENDNIVSENFKVLENNIDEYKSDCHQKINLSQNFDEVNSEVTKQRKLNEYWEAVDYIRVALKQERKDLEELIKNNIDEIIVNNTKEAIKNAENLQKAIFEYLKQYEKEEPIETPVNDNKIEQISEDITDIEEGLTEDLTGISAKIEDLEYIADNSGKTR